MSNEIANVSQEEVFAGFEESEPVVVNAKDLNISTFFPDLKYQDGMFSISVADNIVETVGRTAHFAVIAVAEVRSMFKTGDNKEGESKRPACGSQFSIDGSTLVGRYSPTGCQRCKWSQFGSAKEWHAVCGTAQEKESKAPACSEGRLYFVIRLDEGKYRNLGEAMQAAGKLSNDKRAFMVRKATKYTGFGPNTAEVLILRVKPSSNASFIRELSTLVGGSGSAAHYQIAFASETKTEKDGKIKKNTITLLRDRGFANVAKNLYNEAIAIVQNYINLMNSKLDSLNEESDVADVADDANDANNANAEDEKAHNEKKEYWTDGVPF